MPDAQATIDQILAASEAALRDIADERDKIADRIDSIENPQPLRPLTAAELAEIDKLNAALDALAGRNGDLAVLTLEALNDSAAVAALANSMRAANVDLKRKLEKVQRTAQRLQEVATFIQKLDGIVQNLTRLATLLA